MKKNLFLFILISFTQTGFAQNFITKNGKISFFSKTPLENIDAINNQAASVINSNTGELVFSVLINGFLFKKAQMQEHFNEDYLESTKFPKATFSGKITDLGNINFTKDGKYTVSVTGNLTLHGVTNNLATTANITVKGKTLLANTEFAVSPADYKISIPKIVESNIARSIEIKIDCNYIAR
ncbi:MAG: YceI family protein [Chitinophagaceae bacterium]|nr:YceI family protein [Chitinophagaceae bacterium]